MNLLHVTKVVVLEPYRLGLTFDDGTEGVVDVSDMLSGAIFEPLHNPAVFAQVAIDPIARTVVWPNGADLAPEFLRSQVDAQADAGLTQAGEGR